MWNLPELEEAIERVIAGPERKNRMITEREKKIVAYHESGHALVAKLTPGTDPVHKISIIPRGPALGYTLQLPTEDRYLTSRTELKSRLYVLLGGRRGRRAGLQGDHDRRLRRPGEIDRPRPENGLRVRHVG